MSIFEVVFNLVGLVLGLALVEVLSGLARLVKARDRLKIGWLVPLAGIWALGDVAGFWGLAYEIRDRMHSVWQSLGIGLAITGTYYLAASLVVPANLDDQAHYDAAYWRYKRTFFGLILGCNLATYTIGLVLAQGWSIFVAVINLTYIAALAAIALLPGRRTNIALLLALIAIQIWNFSTP